MSDAPKILIVRLSAIGDVIHGLPVLMALRSQWPSAFLAWVVEGRAAELLEGHPALDAIVRAPRGWLRRAATALDVRRRLRNLDCDIALDLQGLTKSAIAARLSGARRRIGFDGHDGRELSRWLNNERVTPHATHVVDRNLELLAPLGIGAPAADFGWHESAADAAAGETLVDTLFGSLPERPRFALINPGAGWRSKIWPAERFAGVARYLGARREMPSVVAWAGDTERAMAEAIVAQSAGHARLAPATSLRQLAALARRAALFVSADTGPLHLAVAVGTPSVGLFGPMPVERNGPYGPAHLGIQKATLTGGSRGRRSASDATMRAISVDDVTAACDTLLSRSAGRKQCA